MNCEHCESQLLSLVEHDLPATEAEQVREHLSACTSCQQSFDRLAMGHRLAALLPEQEPPAGTHSRILEAARALSRGATPDARGPSTDATVKPAGGGGWRSLVEWLKGLTLGPQVAMAMVMLLVVAIGLIYLPVLHGRPGARGEPVVHPDSEGEAAPAVAAANQPAATADTVTPAQAQQGQQAPAPKASARNGGERGAARLAESHEARRVAGSAAATAHRRAPRLAAARPARRRTARKEAPAAASAGEGMPAGSASAAEDRIAELQEPSAAAANATATRAAPRSPMAKAAPAPARPSSAPTEAEGASRARQGAPTTQSLGGGQNAALLQKARAERAAGSYRSAASSYELYLARTASSHEPARAQAMLEAADCYRRIGRTDRARYWLTVATKIPSTATIARRELHALETAPAAGPN